MLPRRTSIAYCRAEARFLGQEGIIVSPVENRKGQEKGRLGDPYILYAV